MKKNVFLIIILLFFLISFSLLFGCTENQNADFECQVKIDNWNEDCFALKGKAHICQINDPSYSASDGLPSFCTNECVTRSNYLSSVGEECLIITVQDSRFKLNEGETPTIYIEQKYELIKNNTTEEKNNLVEENKIEEENMSNKENIEEEIVQGNCQFDSDCKDTCNGTKIIDYYCDLSNYTCKIAKETDCSIEKELIVGKEYSKTCSNLICTFNKTELEKDKLAVSNLWKEHNNLRQELTNLEVLMDDIMLKQIEGITQELMVKTFNSLNIISGNYIQLIADVTVNSIDDGLNALKNGDQTSMNKADTFSWAYNHREKIRAEIKIIDEKLNIFFNMSKELTETINELN
jgi:hypothetical protein